MAWCDDEAVPQFQTGRLDVEVGSRSQTLNFTFGYMHIFQVILILAPYLFIYYSVFLFKVKSQKVNSICTPECGFMSVRSTDLQPIYLRFKPKKKKSKRGNSYGTLEGT